MQGLRVIIALIILLSIVNTMTVTVMQRIGEIGTSMAMGVKRFGIVRLFLSEGILLGCCGGILGIFAGWGLAAVISAVGIPMPAPPGKTHGYIGGVLVTWTIVGEAFVLVLVTALLASIYPAWKAS